MCKKITCIFCVVLMLMGVFALPICASPFPPVTITAGDWSLNYDSPPSVTNTTQLAFDFESFGERFTGIRYSPSTERLFYVQGTSAVVVRIGDNWTSEIYKSIRIFDNTTIGVGDSNKTIMALWLVGNLQTEGPEGSITINLYFPEFVPQETQAPGQGAQYNGFTVEYELVDSVTWDLEDDINYVDVVLTAEKVNSPSGTRFECTFYAEYASHPDDDVIDYTYTTSDARKVLTGYTMRRGAVLTLFDYVDYGTDASTMTTTEKCTLNFEFVQEYGKTSTYNVYVGRPDLIVDYNGDTTDLDTLIGNAIKDLHDSVGDFILAPNPLVKRVLTVVWINPLSLLLLTPALAFVVVRVVTKRG